MAGEITARWDPAWRPARGLPDGPVTLWMVVLGDGEQVLGAAPMTGRPSWRWQDGKLSLDYTPVIIGITRGGRYRAGLICAVSERDRSWMPMWRLGLTGESEKLRAGDTMTITDGAIALTPNLAPAAARA